MKKAIKLLAFFVSALIALRSNAQKTGAKLYGDPYRPQIHFSPQEHWMNDPNGMVYFNHSYHLFFQYYPGGTTWGPMHWGHAVSADLVHWTEQPIALFPDSLGYIFSGSAVVDSNNTTGFGKNEKIPLVAIFTHHDPKGEKAGKDNFQNESLAYSLDAGKTWTKYAGNPVLKNPGIKDFRDPKVMWFKPGKKWVMTLATKDHITFYSSPDLKDWKKESQFGKESGAHGGVWECPDLFPLKLNGREYWVLIVNINPGGPNGGSATQYFVGDFNGTTFTPIDNKLRWLDYGPDEYAGVTWNNTGSRKIFLGWMSNWVYANQVPTEKWRNAMTVPRELALKRVDGQLFVASKPVKELAAIEKKSTDVINGLTKGKLMPGMSAHYVLNFNLNNINNYFVTLSNNTGEKLVFGYDKASNGYYIDRTLSGTTDFNPQFARIQYAPRLSSQVSSDLVLIVDASSIEAFADNGLSVMTCIFFPNKPYDHLQIQKSESVTLQNVKLSPLKSIW